MATTTTKPLLVLTVHGQPGGLVINHPPESRLFKRIQAVRDITFKVAIATALG